jgi:hypothetical protein
MQTCSLFEQDSVTGLFTLKIVDSTTQATIFHINNKLYFREAKIYLTKIQKITHIIIPNFNPNPNPNPNKQITAFYVFEISNTHVNILLDKIYKNRKFISSLSKQPNHRGRGTGAHRPSGHGVGPHRPRGRVNDRSKPYPVPPSSVRGSRKPVRGGRSISASIVHGMDNLNLR